MTFDEQHSVYIARCEEALSRAIKKHFTPGSKVAESAEYSLLNGGKRIRGVLTLAASDLLLGDVVAAEVFSAAIEMVHSFSLIHDDLPCMDDDDMRRGKPANHIIYGEATAMLAGDALAITALGTLCDAPLPPDILIQAVKTLARASGDRGMIHGQELDLTFETQQADSDTLLEIHRAKTGALILASVELGILAASRHIKDCAVITKYATNIGLSFQILDDILDVTSSVDILGKPVGSDSEKHKSTFVTLHGIEASQKEVQRLTSEAIVGMQNQFGSKAMFLCRFAEKLAERLY